MRTDLGIERLETREVPTELASAFTGLLVGYHAPQEADVGRMQDFTTPPKKVEIALLLPAIQKVR